jgi:endonuclease/exonuclease/phosphatase family metal-dependent hydrolase
MSKAKQEAFSFACEHLSNQGSFVAALQEVPDDDNSQLSISSMVDEHRLRLLSRTTPDLDVHGEEFKSTKSKVILLSSEDIEIDPIGKRHEGDSEHDDTRRLEGVTLRSQSWQDLQILGIHGLDLRNHQSEGKRARWATRMRAIIDQFWENGPIIVMGDMNAHPWSPEIAGRDGLYAIRRKD